MTTVPVIHCHTQADKGTVGYASFMWETMRALATHPDALKISVHCIGPTAQERLKDLPNGKTFYVPNAEVDKGMSGSTAHGACIEDALKMTDDGSIHLLVDGDTVVLAKGWDDYIRIALLDRRVGIIGTAVEDIGGFTSGAGNVQMAKNLPTVAWCALSPRHRWRDLKAMPRKETNIRITTDVQSKIYNLPLGFEVLRDVAWQIPEYLHNNGITYEAWTQLKPSGRAIVLKGLSDYHEEYHLNGSDASLPFVVHQRGSMRHAYRTDRISKSFYGAIDTWLEAEKLRSARWVWSPNDSNKDVLESIEAMAAAALERASAPTPIEPASVKTEATSGTPGATLSGWLKATFEGEQLWSRHSSKAVPATLDLAYACDNANRFLRLEGTVSGLWLALPSGASRSHRIVIRNMLPAAVTAKVTGCSRTVQVPADSCWDLLVDVDGVVKVG